MQNAKFNKKLSDCREIFKQYSQLISGIKNDDIPCQFKSEVTSAQINFLMFSLNSAVLSISEYNLDFESRSHMHTNIENIQQLLSETDSSNPKQCVQQLEKAFEAWSKLCQ